MNKVLILKYKQEEYQEQNVNTFSLKQQNVGNKFHFGFFNIPQSIAPYNVVVVDLINEVEANNKERKRIMRMNEWTGKYSDEQNFLSKLQETNSYLFILNNFGKQKWDQDSLFSTTIMQTLFEIQNKDLDWAQTQHIKEINGEESFVKTYARFSVKETKIKNKGLIPLFKIENSKDIVGWKKNKKYLIPFYKFDEECWKYIKKEIEKQQPPKTITNKNIEQYLETHWKKPFQITKLNELFSKEKLIKKEIETEKEKLKQWQEKIDGFEVDISILNSQGKELETALISFLEKNKINIHKPKVDNEMDFYFQIKNKFVVVEVKGCEKNKIEDKPFGQLLIWRTDLIELLKNQKQIEISDENILEILIINNGYSIHPDERKLTIPSNLKKRHSTHAKVITTINLLRIFEKDNGKEFFEKQILEGKEMQIKPQE